MVRFNSTHWLTSEHTRLCHRMQHENGLGAGVGLVCSRARPVAPERVTPRVPFQYRKGDEDERSPENRMAAARATARGAACDANRRRCPIADWFGYRRPVRP